MAIPPFRSFPMTTRLACLSAAIAITSIATQAHATVLTFDSPNHVFAGNNTIALPTLSDPTLPLYGDHVSAAIMGTVTTPNAYQYGTTYGFTPHIGVSYSPGDSSINNTYQNHVPVFYPTGFGNLTNVLYQVDQYTDATHQTGSPSASDFTLGVT